MNDAIIKKLIAEWQNDFIPDDLKEREFDYSLLELKNKALILAGLRRSGKSYLMFQIIKHLTAKGIPKSNLFYLNFEDERLLQSDISLLTNLIEIIKVNFGTDEKKSIYLFLDEIQSIQGWEKWARRILDKEKGVRLVITGSSSKLSSAQIATEMRGRSIPYNVYPLAFREFLNFKNVDIPENLEFSPESYNIQRNFSQYLLWGGLPEISLLKKTQQKIIILQEYFNTIVNKEIKERHAIDNQAGLDILLKLMVANFSSLTSLSKLHNVMGSIGIKIGKNTLAEYLNYFKESFFVDFIEIFSYNIKNRLQYPRKSYIADNGFIRALTLKNDFEKGRLFENLIFNELKRQGKEINYYKGKNECDFIIKDLVKPSSAIQATLELNNLNKKREIAGLLEAMEVFNLKEGLIITENADDILEEKINGRKVKIKIVPAWRWMLFK